MMTVFADTFMIATRLEPREPSPAVRPCRRARAGWLARARRWAVGR